MPTSSPIAPRSHFVLFSSARIAPIAAKQGGEKRLNIIYAITAPPVTPIMPATSAPADPTPAGPPSYGQPQVVCPRYAHLPPKGRHRQR